MGFAKDYLGWTPDRRQWLFYGVCIWARFGLAALAGWLAHEYMHIVVPIILSLAALPLVYNTYYTFHAASEDWWSRQVHAYSALIIICTCILVLAGEIPPYTVGIYMALDVVYGISFSLMACPFKKQYDPVIH